MPFAIFLANLVLEAVRQDAYGFYSDLFKSYEGVRPCWAHDWSLVELEAATARLTGESEPEPAQPTSGEGWTFTAAA